ncbi:hypothetical protein CKAH01_01386 [Colletotrichum kahawae]|uniref:Uncharacterized protein n=1 Tax=Colletotrichum kahawae TaxID=34407 RepID=A0AAD9Y7K0_COLKA|nr:hypothetical protein CKAH01_01386 [Colletotrichum kahawae]
MELLSRDEHLRFRTMTELLSLTNHVFKPETPDEMPDDRVRADRTAIGRGYVYTSSFANILARKDEFAATALLGMDSDSPRGVIVASSRTDTRSQSEAASENESEATVGQVRCRVTNLNEDGVAEGPLSPYVEDSIIEGTCGPHFQVKSNFIEHASNVVRLLDRMRDARTADTLQQATTQFRVYCIIAGCEKIQARFFRGSRNPDDSEKTVPDDKTSENEITENVATTKRQTESDEIRKIKEANGSSRRNFYNILTHDSTCRVSYHKEEGPLFGRGFQSLSECSLARLNHILQFLRENGYGENIEGYHPSVSKWYHTTKDREAFQHILRSLLGVSAEKLDVLVSSKKAYHETRSKVSKLESERQHLPGTELYRLAVEFNSWIYMLNVFVSKFRHALSSHMDWLKQEFHTENMDSFIASPLYPGVAVYNPSSSLGDYILQEGGMGPYYDQNELGHESFDLSVLDHRSRRSWPRAAMVYLDNITAHSNGMFELEPGSLFLNAKDKRRAMDTLSRTQFQLVDITPNDDDHEKIPLGELLRTFKLFEKTLSEDDQNQICELINIERRESEPPREDIDLETSYFSGESHPEAYVICLHLLAREKRRLGSEFTVPAGIVIPDKEVTDIFQKNITQLAVTGRCCPACDLLIRFSSRRAGVKVVHSEDHRVWTPCSLPPWIPREAGAYMLNFVAEELRERLPEFIEHLWITKDLLEERKANENRE